MNMVLPVRFPDLLKLLPQAPPFVFVDELTRVASETGWSRYVMPPGHFLAMHGLVTAEALLENMAQTGALHQGYMALQKGSERPMGFIASIDRAVFYDLPAPGSCLETEFTLKNLYGAIGVSEGRVFVKGKLLAEAVFKIYSREASSSPGLTLS